MARAFDLEEYMREAGKSRRPAMPEGEEAFAAICETVRAAFDSDWRSADEGARDRRLEREKRAIIGHEREVAFYKVRIAAILQEKQLQDGWFPPWYPDLVEAVFAEVYGLAGLAPWAYDMQEQYRNSSSAKLIGDRMYCLIDGKSCLQPQRIPEERRQQLKRTLLLATPEERLEFGFHEVYLHNGIRITIYSGSRTKEGQDVMVFRKYLLQELTFEEMARLRTIPAGAVELFRCMVQAGFNVIFAGQVRSGKTTFLQTWQKYEDPGMEGLAIATDPETPWHKLMPDAPIMQIVADGDSLSQVSKSLLRGDNDYVLLEEMRDADAFKLALEITSTGTRRSKATVHDNDALNIPYKMASRICEKYGGNSRAIIAQVYQNFDYVLEFCHHPADRSRKVMTGITEFSYDAAADRVLATRICKYDFRTDCWYWNAHLGPDKALLAQRGRGDPRRIAAALRVLASEHPLSGPQTISPAYYQPQRR